MSLENSNTGEWPVGKHHIRDMMNEEGSVRGLFKKPGLFFWGRVKLFDILKYKIENFITFGDVQIFLDSKEKHNVEICFIEEQKCYSSFE